MGDVTAKAVAKKTAVGLELIADVAFVIGVWAVAAIVIVWLVPEKAWIFGKWTPVLVALVPAWPAWKWTRRHQWVR